MTPEQKALRDAFLAELWKPCPELSREERETKRVADEIAREQSRGIAVESTPETVEEGAA